MWHTFTADERTLMSGEVKGLGFADAVLELMGKESKTSKDETKQATKATTGTGTASSSSTKSATPPSSVPGASTPNHPIISPPKNTTAAAKLLSEESLVDSPAPTNRAPLNDNDNDNDSASIPKAAAVAAATPRNGDTGSTTTTTSASASSTYLDAPSQPATSTADAIFRPSSPLIIPTNDLNIDFERRTTGTYSWSLTTSVAHVWFNTFFEGNGPEQDGLADESGVFTIEWEAMDGIKGSSRKGTRAFDRIGVVWRVVERKGEVREPEVGEADGGKAAAWRQEGNEVVESSDEDEHGVKPHRTRE